MKAMKKLAVLALTVCLAVPCFSMFVYAADGKIMFTDPSTKVGETVEVKGVVEKTSGNFGKIEITMTYDTTMLTFKSGDGATESSKGTVKYVGDATNDVGKRKEFVLKFDALKKGTTALSVSEATVKNVSGTVLNYTKGSSKITIAAGEGGITEVTGTLSEATVDVNGETYKFADAVPQNEIPEGYVAATLEYDLVKYNVVYNENTGLYLAYLVNADNVGALFMYVEEDATFDPFETIAISDRTTIAVLSDVSGIVLPKEYKKTQVVLRDREFPAWQSKEDPDFCIIYAIDNYGQKSLYQLDNAQDTYQRFTAPEVVADDKDTSLIGKISEVFEKHMDTVVLGTGLGFLLFVVIIVILSVKLYNRNAELDEIYDEYGISDKDDTENDVLLGLDEEEDDEEEPYVSIPPYLVKEEEKVDKEAEFLVQEGMREVFPEEDIVEEDIVQEVEQKILSEEMSVVEEMSQEFIFDAQEEDEEEEVAFVVPQKEKKEPDDIVISIPEPEHKADSLSKVLAEQMVDEKEEDDDEFFENFSVDFIDLDE